MALIKFFLFYQIWFISVFADSYHYKTIIIGERAVSLGGAYAALSDDPSGVYHNPAGIAFSYENYLSISANAYSNEKRIFENIYPGQNYVYNSGTLIPTFFGFIQTLGKGKFGFSVIVPQYDFLDQEDKVNKPATDSTPEAEFQRKFFQRDITYLVGLSYGEEIMKNLSFGVSLFGVARIVRLIDNLVIKYNPIGQGKYFIYQSFLNKNSFGTFLKLGLEYMPAEKISIGFTLGKPFTVTGSSNAKILQNNSNGKEPVEYNGTFNNDIKEETANNLAYYLPEPISASLGIVYFFNKNFLISAQLDYWSKENSYYEYPLSDTYNFSIGSEYFILEELALRLGLFTNNANTKKVAEGGVNQPPHVDMYSASFGVSYFRSGSSLSMDFSYSYGRGYGQAFSDTPTIQRVTQDSIGIYLSGSYQL